MALHSTALRSPALDDTLLMLPEVGGARFDSAAFSDPAGFFDSAEVRERLTQAHARAREQAHAGDEVLRAAFALQGEAADAMLPLVAAEVAGTLRRYPAAKDPAPEGPGGDAQCIAGLQAQAAALAAAGDVAGAVTVLCALLDWPEACNDALLGLAICALRLDRHDAALVFALDYLKRGGRHPRAHCVAGLCRMQLRDRKAAQSHLAAAARAARGDLRFRDELRAAQRLLIMLNFGG
ncbi:MAG: hypothetical protein ACOYJQ_00385 [Pseudochelatococcus sp.]|jgi:hypothetical protein|uniref:hypothetical protein n=1 Tax=Pseudochelatococcus sp. TaxID=2020869 RepID=UPI003D8A407F